MTGQLENTASTQAAPHAVSMRHPLGFWFFFWGEFAERCSYYGMKTILPVYLTGVLHFTDTRGGAIMNWFKMGCYLLPLLGGYVADRFFGKYWTIVGFSIPYVLGHFILGIPNDMALIIALMLLAGGSGVIKPNISTLMGLTYDQKRPGQEQLRAAAFLWFYFAINVGALISTFTLPLVTKHYGGDQHAYAIAFQVPAWLMVAALIVFASGKPHYAVESLVYKKPTPEERKERWRTLARLAGVFGLIFFFWVGYEFNDNIWIYFIRDYVNLDVDMSAFGLSKGLRPEQLQTLNPLCVMIFAPLFAWSFAKIDPGARVFTAANKILAGFIMCFAASATMAAAGFLATGTHTTVAMDAQSKVSIAWPAAAYVFLTLGEILVYGTGLEFAYAAAPKSMKGFVTGCFLALDAGANFVNAWLVGLYGGSLVDRPDQRGSLSAGAFFSLAALIVLAATIAFYFVGRRMDHQRELA
jgi:POT family proton-dependent oligopeptide transporter